MIIPSDLQKYCSPTRQMYQRTSMARLPSPKGLYSSRASKMPHLAKCPFCQSSILTVLGGHEWWSIREQQKMLKQSTIWQLAFIETLFVLADDIQVGPLPPSKSTKIEPLEFCYNSNRNWVPHPLPDQVLLSSWMVSFGQNISDILDILIEGVSIFRFLH